MNVALTFICLRDKEIGNMTANVVFVADGVATKDLLETAKY